MVNYILTFFVLIFALNKFDNQDLRIVSFKLGYKVDSLVSINYGYDHYGRLSKSAYVFKNDTLTFEDYVYDNQNKLIKHISSKKSGELNLLTVFSYNNNIATAKYYMKDMRGALRECSFYREYFLNSQNQCFKEIYYYKGNTDTINLFWENGNLLWANYSYASYGDTLGEITEYFEYDNKNNPFRNFPESYFSTIQGHDHHLFFASSQNCLLKKGTTQNLNDFRSYDYEYNEFNLPIRAKYKYYTNPVGYMEFYYK
jgi:hypothetical protein